MTTTRAAKNYKQERKGAEKTSGLVTAETETTPTTAAGDAGSRGGEGDRQGGGCLIVNPPPLSSMLGRGRADDLSLVYLI